MRARGGLLPLPLLLSILASLAAGCLVPPSPSLEDGPSAGGGEADVPVIAREDATAARAEETLHVRWSPQVPVPGEILSIDIDAPIHWPAPRCNVNAHVGRDASPLTAPGGGGGMSAPAREREDGRGYLCELGVPADSAAVSLTVTREDGDRTRIHGPHVLVVPREGTQQTVAFERFDLLEDEAGLPYVDARVHPLHANVRTPQVGPLYDSNMTHHWLQLEVIPLGNVLHMGHWWALPWATPVDLRGTIDVPARIREAEADFGEEYPERDFVLMVYAVADSEHAFAVSEPRVAAFGACADGSCHVVDG